MRPGAHAYALSDAHALAQLAEAVAPEFQAKTALHVRAKGHMKDTPALLLVVLARRDPALFAAVFNRMIDNCRMLRTFVQFIRSGQTGRKSLGSRPKAMVQHWLNAASDRALLAANVDNDPSLADVIRMGHPKLTRQRGRRFMPG